MFLQSIRTKVFLLVLGLFLASMAIGQDANCDLVLSGKVIDDHDRTPLSYAEIFIPELLVGDVSDEEGHYRIEGLCPGIYLIRVTHLGCEPVERRVDLQRSTVLDIRMEHHHEELRELEVIRDRPDENVGLAKTEIDRAAMEQRSGRGLAEVLEGINGVNILRSGPTIAKPIIHGLSGNRILTLNQGIRQEDQQWGTDHAPNLDPFSTDRISVVKGAASVQYGSDAIGGVVITEPVELPRESGVAGEFRSIGMLNGRGGGASGMLNGAVRKVRGLGWRVQGSARQLGDSEAPDYVLSNTGLREASGSASVGVKRHWGNASVYYSWFGRELGILRAAHIGNLTDLNNAINSGQPWFQAPFSYEISPPRQVAVHHLLKTEVAYRLSERDQLVITYAYQADDRQEYDNRRGGRSGIPALDLFLTTHTADAVVKHWIGPHIHGKVGVNGIMQDNFNVPGTGIRPLIPDYSRKNAGVFIVEHFPINERLELEAGARLEGTRLNIRRFAANDVFETPEHRFLNHAFSTGANWNPRDSIQIRANISSAFRPPHVSELYSQGLHHGSAAIEQGDPELGNERSLKATLDVQTVWLGGRLTTDLTLYQNFINGFIYLRPAGYRLTIRGAFPVFDNVATDVSMHGLDATVLFNIAGPWAIRSQVSLVRARDMVLDEWLFQMPSDRFRNSLLFRKKTFGAWRDAELSMTSDLVLQQSRYPVGLDFISPPPTYHLVGVSASAELPIKRNSLRVGITGENLFNRPYRDYLDRFRYFADARGLDVVVWLRYSFGQAR
jgi:iron complex outermembrane recepter protein